MKFLRLALFLLSWLCLAKGYSQDKIVTNNGIRLYCKIVREDSVSLYYILVRQSVVQMIPKSDVFKYSRTIPRAERAVAVSSSTLHSIEKPDLLLISLAGGFANPLGDFANMDVSSDASGLAKQGYVFQGALILKLAKYIGVSAAYHFQTHAINSEAFNNVLAAANPGFQFSTTSSNWIIRGFFGGLYLTAPIKTVDGLSVFATGMIGLPVYVSPELKTTASKNGQSAIITQYSSKSSAAGYLGGVGISYKVLRELGLHLSVNYFSGKASFSDVYTSNNAGVYNYSNFKQKFESINIQAGLFIAIQ